MARRLVPTGICWCGCETKVDLGSFFAQGHDKKGEAKVIKEVFGSVPAFMAAFGYAPGGNERLATDWTDCATQLAGLPQATTFKIEYVNPEDPSGPFKRTTARVTFNGEVDLSEGGVTFAVHRGVQSSITIPFSDIACVYKDGTWIVRIFGSLVVEHGQFGDAVRYVARPRGMGGSGEHERRNMKLTEFDRLILINALSMRRALQQGDAREMERQIEILRGGYELFYEDVSSFHGLRPTVPMEHCKFVVNVLQVYRFIEHYKQRNPRDTEFARMPGSYFEGFDGNDEFEGACMSLTRFIIQTQDKFIEQRPYAPECDEWNSHSPRAGTYRRMIAKWNDIGRPTELSREQAISIISA